MKGALLLLLTVFSAAGQSQSTPKETLLQRLLRIAGLTAAPSQMRAPDSQPGDIWLVALPDGMTRALTEGGGYRSPVFGPSDAFVYALREDVVVRIPAAGGMPAGVRLIVRVRFARLASISRCGAPVSAIPAGTAAGPPSSSVGVFVARRLSSHRPSYRQTRAGCL